jgi:uncharacterized protein
MKQAIVDFVAGKRVAVLGASRAGKKFGNYIVTELKQRGYEVFLVHPEAQEIGGETCYPNLAAVAGQVDGAVISLPPAQSGEALREAAAAGIKNVWVQQGGESPETQALADELGLKIVTGRCILMYAQPVGSFHAWHRAFARLTGQL